MPRTLSLPVLAGLVLALLGGPADAQEAPVLRPAAPGTPQPGAAEGRPSPAILPADDDYAYLGRVGIEPRLGDRFRRIPLGDGVTLSFSGLAYLELEGFEDGGWGAVPGWDDYANSRLNLYGQMAFGDRTRVFAALKHGDRVTGREAPSPAERDGADLHQLFGELSFGDAFGGDPKDALIRVGRQELHYGAGRMISVREGPNVRDDFDGVLVRLRRGGIVADAFAAYDVEDDRGGFDNDTVEDDAVWGLYGSGALPGRVLGRGHALDLYYMGERRSESPYAFAAPVAETRHTVGLRWFSAGPPSALGWTFDAEAAFQFGGADPLTIGPSLDVRAWTATAGMRRNWDGPWSPGLRLAALWTSGDDDPDDGDLGTFRAPNPPGRYFGEATPLGPGNLAAVALTGFAQPMDRLSLALEAAAFWRIEESDGLYSPAGGPLRAPGGGSDHVGNEVNLTASYALTPSVTLGGTLAYFDTNPDGPIALGGPAEDIARVKLGLDVRF